MGIKQKECIFLTLQGEGMLFEDIGQATKGVLSLIKNTWGFMPIYKLVHFVLGAQLPYSHQLLDRAVHPVLPLDPPCRIATYLRHQDSWLLLYMLLKLDSRYKNAYKKLEALEEQYEFGIRDVLFYLEAYLCYQEKPMLLKKLGKFEIRVLGYSYNSPGSTLPLQCGFR